MKKNLLLIFLFVLPCFVVAQLTIVSTQPANLAKNVPLTTTISITFSEALDTVAMNNNSDNTWFSNIDSMTSSGYSADQKTSYAVVVLKPNTSYFMALMYAKAKSGAVLAAPVVYYFTSGADFSAYSVSGTISSGSTGISVDGAVVGLSKINFMTTKTEGPPPFGGWANVNSNGTFTIPYVANGTYWPLVAKDVDKDGNIDPGKGGDLVVMGDSIVVNNASVTGVKLSFFDVVSTQPANNAKNVPLTTTISMTFSEALDTNAINQNGGNTWFDNLDSMVSYGYSADLKTTFGTYVLKPNKSYFVAFMYVKAKSGAVISTPYVYYFTTGADFSPYSVSGTILPGTTGVSPAGAIVGLANVNIMKDEGKDGAPPFVSWTNVNSNGTYTVPNLPNGKYWPIAAKDVNHDGELDPDNGIDVMAAGDSIIINNGSVNNFNMTFFNFQPLIFSESIKMGDSLAKNLPADKVLRRISGWDIDTTGRARKWEYHYTYSGGPMMMGSGISIRASGSETYPLDPNYVQWIQQLKPVTGYKTAASSATVIANIEAAGGKAFRMLPHADTIQLQIELTMADQKNGWFGSFGFDTSKIYWAAAYTHVYQINNNQSTWVKGKFFLCDQVTGSLLLTQNLMNVKQDGTIPGKFLLKQNYPNPFNPTTNISFTIPASSFITLRVFDILGKEVAVLVNGKVDAGEYDIPFNASKLSSGIYFYQLRSGNFVETKKMVLMR